MSGTELPASLIAAYRATDYWVSLADNRFPLRIGEWSQALADLLRATSARKAVFITAENPFSEATSASANEAAMAGLRRDLEKAGATIFEGYGQGQDTEWPPEASFLALGIGKREGGALGRKYRQNAIVWIGPDAIPELVFLR
ncbi:DUF3293 domain-containing protein [Erythrobacter sp.]|uniref:DUF3293 domain-containing protein n=1 Tax=Erythrobacter sp. TaxID=1042 RepID=UPI001425BE07|nr:DUF3293 domain-containing protein [Erythrobacter sp.]QIQ85714.1 MAG: DUF3293 domain-containing protein [Erythrobacter sp.]